MPLTVVKKTRKGRGGHYDKFVRQLAPAVREIQAAGVRDLRKTAAMLNEAGYPTSCGGPFHFSAARRLVRRLAELGLAQTPRTNAQAQTERPYKQRRSRPRRFRPDALMERALQAMAVEDGASSRDAS